MRLVWLYFWSRRGVASLAGLVLVGIVGGIWADWSLPVPQFGRVSWQAFVPAALFIPLLSDCIIGVNSCAPFGDPERTVSYRLPTLRLIHLGLLLVSALLTLAVGVHRWDDPNGEQLLARNLVGFTGLALGTVWMLGSRLAWVLPIADGGLALLTGYTRPNEYAVSAGPIHPPGVGPPPWRSRWRWIRRRAMAQRNDPAAARSGLHPTSERS